MVAVSTNKPEKYGEFIKNPKVVNKFLDLVARGFTMKEAALRLGVSSKAVEKCVTLGRKYQEDDYKGKINPDIVQFEHDYTRIIQERGWNGSVVLKLDRYVINTIAEFIKEGFTLKRAASQLGLAHSTVNHWIRKGHEADPTSNPLYIEFAAAVEAAMAVQEQRYLDRMGDLAFNARSEKVAYEATSWTLERVHGYKEVRRNENINQNTEITITAAPTETGYTLTELEWEPNQALEEGKDASEE